ncbi:ATP synthase F0 subunit B [Calothrix sp. NIES-4071]|nr:ATP synthase F0 subunit B [Calothrix sp. NIES-4071]BAZ59793.1 ATP synthase F0 subunit B [Calothrix sp. NIES-4105]
MGIMGTLILLATEAVAGHASEGGFGLNLDILETNIINLAILVGVLVVFGRKFLTDTLSARRSGIEIEIKEAEQRAKEAATALSEAQKNLTQAQQEAERIRKSATDNAQKAKEAILARAQVDVQRLKDNAAADLTSEQDKAIAQLRARVVALALEKAESELKSGIADDAQHALIDRSIALLGGR